MALLLRIFASTTPRSRVPMVVFVVMASLLGAFASPSSAHGDDVAAYLERLGLDELRAAYLEQQLRRATGAEQMRFAEQLARVYGNLLDHATSAEERRDLEGRLVALLDGPLAGSTPEFRLPLLRSRYRVVETAAERYRLALDDEGEVERARAAIEELMPELTQLEAQISRRADTLRDRYSRAAAAQTSALRFDMERALDRLAQVSFLLAWADYYRLMLLGNPEYGRSAERRFGRLLSLELAELAPENVSQEMRGEEAFARCILGMALVRARLRSPESGLAWLELLDVADAWGPLRERLDVWRIVIRIEGGDASEAHALLRAMEAEEAVIDAGVLRLGAAAGMRSSAPELALVDLMTFCIQRLAADGEYGQLYDLARRFGLDRISVISGFAAPYVTGIVRLHEARTIDESDPGRARRLREEAAANFDAARAASDATRHPEALTECIRLSGATRLELGRDREAAEDFAIAAARLTGVRAADALAAAIDALERVVDADPSDAAIRARWTDLIDRFAVRFPDDARSVILQLRRAVRITDPSMEDVEDLLRVPAEVPHASEARRVAADLLFRMYRAAQDPDERVRLAAQFLDVAAEVHRAHLRTFDMSSGTAITRFIFDLRRLLEVALLPGAENVALAGTLLEEAEGILRSHPEQFAEIEPEFRYRRLTERLLAGDSETALSEGRMIRAAEPEGRWARAVDRTIFTYADRMWRAADRTEGTVRRAINLMVEHGGREADHALSVDSEVRRTETAAILMRVAEAELEQFRLTMDRAKAERGWKRMTHVLAARPRDVGALRIGALLSEALESYDEAITMWRALVAGLPEGSIGWFEARAGQIRVLAELDRASARTLLDAHRLLYPDYGPEPHGEELRRLDLFVLGSESENVP